MAMSLEEFLKEWNNPSPNVHVQTSGSTGTPKPMLVEKSRMLASARITNDFLGLHPGDTALLCMSLDYIAGKMMVVRAIERELRLVCIEPSGHPLRIGDWPKRPVAIRLSGGACPQCEALNDQTSLSFAAMVPLQVYNSLQVPSERERLMQIRHLIIGGGAIDDVLADELKTFPNAVWSTYGMTETLSHIALRRLSGPEASLWYTPFPSVTVSLSDESTLCYVRLGFKTIFLLVCLQLLLLALGYRRRCLILFLVQVLISLASVSESWAVATISSAQAVSRFRRKNLSDSSVLICAQLI